MLDFSIITPSFNQGKFIRETILSVLNQKDVTLEYFVADGGSTDETCDILKSFNDQLKWVSEKDDGQADAVNKGFRLAQGEFVGWLNSDDLYFPDALKVVKAYFDDHPEAQVVYGNAEHVEEDGTFIEDYPTEDWDYEHLKNVCFICQPSVFFRRSAFDKVGILEPRWQFCMDYEYWLRIGQTTPMIRLPQKLAKSRLYQDNKTLGQRVPVHKEILEMFFEKFHELPSKWLFNYAHAKLEAEDLNLAQSNPWSFRVKLTKEIISISKQVAGRTPWKELLQCAKSISTLIPGKLLSWKK